MKKWNKSRKIFVLVVSILIAVSLFFLLKGNGNALTAAIKQKWTSIKGMDSPADEDSLYATSHKEGESIQEVEEYIEETETEAEPTKEWEETAMQPLTEEIIKIQDIYVTMESEVTMRSFYPQAVSYVWEEYDMQTQEWKAVESRIGVDELYREVSLCTVFCEKSLSPIMLRCIVQTADQEYMDVAAIQILDKEIQSLSAAPVTVNAGSYLSAKDIPVTVTYTDGSEESITGLYGLYWLQEEEASEYSMSISGNMVETVTKVLTDLEYRYIELGETEAAMRYRMGEKRIELPVTVSGKDLKAPNILKVELGEYEISRIDEPIPIQVTITAVDNYTIYTALSYCFLPQGVEPQEDDWNKSSSWEALIDKNGTWVAYVRDEQGNVATSEKEIIAVDQRAPVMKVSLENTDWCEETKILVEATDNLSILYSFSCPETGENSGWIETAEYTIKHNGLWLVSAKDSLENIATQEFTVSNIDKQPPVIRQITVTTTNTRGENE